MLAAACSYLTTHAQYNVIPSPELNKTVDSVTMSQIMYDLNAFIKAKEKVNSDNAYILAGHLPETSALLDEMKAIERSEKIADTSFYKAYLTNLARLDSSKFIIGISYIGVKDAIPHLRASFKLMGVKINGAFRFYAPLKEYTAGWKTIKIDPYNFYYRDTINEKALRQYCETVAYYDQKIGVSKYPTDFYCCCNLDEALGIIGVDYKSDYSGYAKNSFSAKEEHKYLVVNGAFTPEFTFDPHDLFHERLRFILSKDSINRPVDEGCAYLYGGSWGISWEGILKKFRDYAAAYPEADWLKLYIEKKNFLEGNTPLSISYAINALLVQKLEQERGFPAVLQLASCGKREDGDANYFMALEKTMGITKARFNEVVGKLIISSE